MERTKTTIFCGFIVAVTLRPNIVDGIPAQLSRRIAKETKQLQEEPTPGISAVPDDRNMMHFHVKIDGPKGTPYAGGVFHLDLLLPEEYPQKPPHIKFITKIFHPNIGSSGEICLDTIKCKWTPALQIRTVLLSIQALLADPNPDSPLNSDAGYMFKHHSWTAYWTAKVWTMRHARG